MSRHTDLIRDAAALVQNSLTDPDGGEQMVAGLTADEIPFLLGALSAMVVAALRTDAHTRLEVFLASVHALADAADDNGGVVE